MITLFILLILGAALIAGAASVILALIWYLLLALGRWRMFEKMGEPGWKGLIPIYADYILYGRCWQPMLFWVSLVAAIVSGIGGNQEHPGFLISIAGTLGSVLDAMLCWKVSKAFGHGILFTLGLILLNPIFTLYLGFGPDAYRGPQS